MPQHPPEESQILTDFANVERPIRLCCVDSESASIRTAETAEHRYELHERRPLHEWGQKRPPLLHARDRVERQAGATVCTNRPVWRPLAEDVANNGPVDAVYDVVEKAARVLWIAGGMRPAKDGDGTPWTCTTRSGRRPAAPTA